MKPWQGRRYAPGRLKPCGTLAAYRRHGRHGEKPCQPCRQANADAQRAKRTPAVHLEYVPDHYAGHPACGHREDHGALKLTDDPRRVTCANCKRSRPYRTAVAR